MRSLIHAIRRFGASEDGEALAVAVPEAAREQRRLFTTWRWGGYVAWAVPGLRAFVDPLTFTAADVEAYGRILKVEERWAGTLDDWGVDLALVPTAGRLAQALRSHSGWVCRRLDATATLCERADRGGVRIIDLTEGTTVAAGAVAALGGIFGYATPHLHPRRARRRWRPRRRMGAHPAASAPAGDASP
ncbi:MAG: hypothetical protein FJ361_01110 [Gemmatimonadetes bacterium]|nr:hypothetical protein [Gemmatimonadota bacterium]